MESDVNVEPNVNIEVDMIHAKSIDITYSQNLLHDHGEK